MGHVIAIFGTLIALNLGFGYWLSEQSDVAEPEQGVVEVEEEWWKSKKSCLLIRR